MNTKALFLLTLAFLIQSCQNHNEKLSQKSVNHQKQNLESVASKNDTEFEDMEIEALNDEQVSELLSLQNREKEYQRLYDNYIKEVIVLQKKVQYTTMLNDRELLKLVTKEMRTASSKARMYLDSVNIVTAEQGMLLKLSEEEKNLNFLDTTRIVFTENVNN